ETVRTVSAGTMIGLGGEGDSFFIIVFEASGADGEASLEAGDAAESEVAELLAWSADFWQPANARRKHNAKTLATEWGRRLMKNLRVKRGNGPSLSTILRIETKSISGNERISKLNLVARGGWESGEFA